MSDRRLTQDDYVERLAEAAEQLGRAVDVLVNEAAPVPEALPNQTVSDHVARAAQEGKRWACWFCAFLSWAVQKDHCRETLTGGPMPWWVYVRAGFWFAMLAFLPVFLMARAVVLMVVDYWHGSVVFGVWQ